MYLAWNRREFTEVSFPMLLANTDWEHVRQLHVYDDGSTDGTKEFLYEAIHECPVEYHMHDRDHTGPDQDRRMMTAWPLSRHTGR